jgi:hypothetical protein
MDDYSISSLSESKNEWCARLVNLFTPAVIAGLKSIFNEAWTLCKDNDEEDKYLMTFQTFLSRVPKWNSTIIEAERKRISASSGCGYLEELITCVHIIQLKALSCVRVGQKQKKIDINIPSVDDFVHKVYINVARKLYTNIYLFEIDIAPLQIQKHNRELELIIKECVLNTVRDTMPVETLLRAYMDETQEQDVEVNEEEIVKVDETPQVTSTEATAADQVANAAAQVANAADQVAAPAAQVAHVATAPVTNTPVTNTPVTNTPVTNTPVITNDAPNTIYVPTHVATPIESSFTNDRVGFSNIDNAISTTGIKSVIDAPKTIERLEQIANESAERRKAEENDAEDKISIGTDVNLDLTDINDLNSNSISLNTPVILDDVELIV